MFNMKRIFALACIIGLVTCSDGLRCWACENQPSNDACQQLGKIQFCFSNQEACQNEVRRYKDGIIITKRCKQGLACDNNFRQNNKAAWDPSQCNSRVPSSVCKCCCSSDGCNAPALACLENVKKSTSTRSSLVLEHKPECFMIDTPLNGQQRCAPELNDRARTASLGTICKFSCNKGFDLIGSDTSECVYIRERRQKIAAFAQPTPECQKKLCPELLDPENGFKTCSSGRELGSSCKFGCGETFSISGALQTICSENDGKVAWNDSTPSCLRKQCSKISDPLHGFKSCTDGVSLGSACEFVCNADYVRTGSLYSTCIEIDGKLLWDNPPPNCAPINRCEEQELRHGEVVCDDPELSVSTTCTFVCVEPGYTLLPPTVTQNTCLNNTTWDVEPPCCAKECPTSQIDFVVALDSSSSVGVDNWKIVKRFVRALLRNFDLGPNKANLGVFRYNGEVDSDSQILLNNYTEDMDQLLQAFDNIPYNGRGTNTGLALAHARNIMFNKEHGNRPDVPDLMLVITDGRSQDDVASISGLLRSDGVVIYVLGIIPPGGQLDIQQLIEIAGGTDNLIIATGGFEDLMNTMFSNTASDEICETSCQD